MSACRKPDAQAPFVACSGHPLCKERVYLPRATNEVSVSEDHCQNCSHGIVYKLELRCCLSISDSLVTDPARA